MNTIKSIGVSAKDKNIQEVLDEIADKYLDTDEADVYGKLDDCKFISKVDSANRFVEIFSPITGFYARSGVYNENHVDTKIDPFMRSFPQLIDVGIMGSKCVCAERCVVDCYQKSIDRKNGKNMSLDNYISILEQCKGKVFSFALGGSGDVDTHENFEDILRITREYGVVPNFTSSGICMTKEKAEICKRWCGAVAISMHFADYTYKAIQMLLDAGVETNIHYVLSNKSIDTAIDWLKNDKFPKGIHAVIWLLYKDVGLGKTENVLKVDDPRVKEFFELIDTKKYNFNHGFDSCSIAGLINFTSNINPDSIDTCESARWSAYITSDMKMLPCSFDNQDLKWAVDLNTYTIQEAWDSDVFEDFRSHFRNSCKGCKDRENCRGGCVIRRNIVLCDRKEKDLR